MLYSINLPSGNSTFDVDIALFDNHTEIIPAGSHHRKLNKERGKGKRDGFNGYHSEEGAVKVLMNSDLVAAWDDVINWTDLGTVAPDGQTPDISSLILMVIDHEFTNTDSKECKTTQMGMSLTEKWQGKYTGQFGVTAKKWGEESTWEKGFNWCFGPYPTECGHDELRRREWFV